MTVLPSSLATKPHAADEPSTLAKALAAPDTGFTRWLVTWRWLFFAGLFFLIVLPFNGQWRIGLDSSIYRGVADSLAQHGTYEFAGRRQAQVYPGLPVMLAGLQKLFGTTSLVPPLVVMNALTALTLAGVYQLIKRHYPLWIAVVVTCGVGMNGRYLIQAQEIMTDMPFLFAVVWAMLAWDWLRTAVTWRSIAGCALLMIVCLFIAATMRPTFWVLGVAWGLSATWNAVRHRDKRSMIAVGVLGVVLVGFVLVDPRRHGVGMLQGVYEKQLMVILPDLVERLKSNGMTLFSRELPEAFFNEQLWGAGTVFAILLLAGSLIVLRRQPMWGLQVFILTAIMLAISDVPRYYLMVLPTLWLGYVLVLLMLTVKAKPVVRDAVLFGMFSLANFQNLGGTLRLVVEQHSGKFMQEYKHGSYVPANEMAKLLREKIGPNDVVIGPGAQVLSYLSGRQVVNGRLLGFDAAKPSRYPDLLAAAKPSYLIGPASEYDKKDTDLYKLLMHGVVVPGKLIARTEHMWLAEAKVVVPGDDWRKTPRVAKVSPIAANKRPAQTAEQIRNRQIKYERAQRQAYLERKKLKAQRAERQAYLERKRIKAERQRQKAAATQPAVPK